MKTIKLTAFSLLILFLAGCYVYQPPVTQAPPPPPVYTPATPPPPPSDYQSFYDQLAPYGTWVSYPQYGYVWVPNAEPGFRPYVTDGYWAYSDAGWTWVSNYDWGWAPFHYGRWFADPNYGWMWVPGNEWAPAWVTWGNYNGYYGWAPIAPGYDARSAYNPPINTWCFTDARYMGDRGWGNHYYVSNGNRIVINNNVYVENVRNITVINNTNNYNSHIYNAGPRRDEIENVTRTPIRPVTIRDNNAPSRSQVSDNSLNIYRPSISNETRTNQTARPTTVAPIENVRQRNAAPATQPARTPEINRDVRPGSLQPAIIPSRSEPVRENPAPSPQRNAPIQENRPSSSPVREAPATQPERQPATRPVNRNSQANPSGDVNRAAPPAQQQQGRNANRRNVKPVKPAKNQQVKPQPEPREKVTPERRE